MDKVALFQVDAFTDRPFAGNPAAVCPLERWLPDAVMQRIAAENNLSETAFFVAGDDGLALRWFTPTVEVDLCGHATLAAGFVWMNQLDPGCERVVFHTRSGPLAVERQGARYTLDLPARPPSVEPASPALEAALGLRPLAVYRARDLVALLPSSQAVRALAPDLGRIAALEGVFAVCVTAPGDGEDADVDFVSRFFAPAEGVPEDPVTGSAHCTLTPFWAERLGRDRLRARQVSRRGGELWCERSGDRVKIGGHAVLVITGELRF